MTGSISWPICIPLYSTGVCWSLFYDTIYAIQDVRDDTAIGVKSTAVYYGDAVKPFLGVVAAGMTGSAALAGLANASGWLYYCFGVGGVGLHLASIIYRYRKGLPTRLNIRAAGDAAVAFKRCVWTGVLLLLGITSDSVASEYFQRETQTNDKKEDWSKKRY